MKLSEYITKYKLPEYTGTLNYVFVSACRNIDSEILEIQTHQQLHQEIKEERHIRYFDNSNDHDTQLNKHIETISKYGNKLYTYENFMYFFNTIINNCKNSKGKFKYFQEFYGNTELSNITYNNTLSNADKMYSLEYDTLSKIINLLEEHLGNIVSIINIRNYLNKCIRNLLKANNKTVEGILLINNIIKAFIGDIIKIIKKKQSRIMANLYITFDPKIINDFTTIENIPKILDSAKYIYIYMNTLFTNFYKFSNKQKKKYARTIRNYIIKFINTSNYIPHEKLNSYPIYNYLESIVKMDSKDIYNIIKILESIKDDIDDFFTTIIKNLYENNTIQKLFEDLKSLLLSILPNIKGKRMLSYPFYTLKQNNLARGKSGRLLLCNTLRCEHNNNIRKLTKKVTSKLQHILPIFNVSSYLHD
jgi:hypothetical protein